MGPPPGRGLLRDAEAVAGELSDKVLVAVDRLRSEWKARREVDVPGMVAGLRARLESRQRISPLPVEADLADRRGPFGYGRVRSFAFESAELRKGVIAHVDLRPMVEGLALTLAPRRELDAPVFAADLMVLPSRLSAHAEVYGAAARTRGVLAPLATTFARLGGLSPRPGPEWTAAIASGEGLHARGSARLVDDLYAGVTSAFARYLDVLAAAGPAGAAAPAIAAEQGAFFAAFHAHGPRTGPLGRIFGAPWAERFSRLLFE